MSGWDFTSVAKSAFLSAQKRIDTALDIRELNDKAQSTSTSAFEPISGVRRLQDDFFSAFGLKNESKKDSGSSLKSSSPSNNDIQSWSSWLGQPSSVENKLEHTSTEEKIGVSSLPASKSSSEVCNIPSSKCSLDFMQVNLSSPFEEQIDFEPVLNSDQNDLEQTWQSTPEWTDSNLSVVDWEPNPVRDSLPEQGTSLAVLGHQSPIFNTHLNLSANSSSTATLLASTQSVINYSTSYTITYTDDQIDFAVYSLLDELVSSIHSNFEVGSVALMVASPPTSTIKGSGWTSPLEELEDLETAASSDIEVISTPNGDNWSERSGRIHGHSQPLIPRGHRRSQLSMSELLEKREQKLMEMARENCRILEETERLSRLLEEEKCKVNSGELAFDNMREKYSRTCEERDELRAKCEWDDIQLAAGESEFTNVRQLKNALLQKDEQIQDLLKEGEKLSAIELKQSNILKKLREKERETKKLLAVQDEKLVEMNDLRQKLKASEEQELKYDDAVHHLRASNFCMEKKYKKIELENGDLQEKNRSLKISIEGCYQQIGELHREMAAKETAIQTLTQQADLVRERELSSSLERIERERVSERQELLKQLDNMRVNSEVSNGEFDRLEKALREENRQLQREIQDAESRNQQLAGEIEEATFPLIRQLEIAHNSHANQQAIWESLEKSLYDRIVEFERKASNSIDDLHLNFVTLEKFRLANEELKRKLSSQESETAIIVNKLKIELKEKDGQDRDRERCQSEWESEKLMLRNTMDEVISEKDCLSEQFDKACLEIRRECKSRIEKLEEELQDKERTISSLRTQLLEMKLTPINKAEPDDEIGSKATRRCSWSNLSTDDDLLFDLDCGSSTVPVLVERLRRCLQQRDCELSVLRDQLHCMQHSRDGAIDRVSCLTGQLVSLQNSVVDYARLECHFKELHEKHQALLQMYGEKVEQAEELQLDLLDVKTLYRQQIDHLVQKTAD